MCVSNALKPSTSMEALDFASPRIQAVSQLIVMEDARVATKDILCRMEDASYLGTPTHIAISLEGIYACTVSMDIGFLRECVCL